MTDEMIPRGIERMRKNVEREKLLKEWLHEEEIAHIQGWDFSHIEGKYEVEQDLPWDYREIVLQYLKPEKKVLDIDTGGGEFLLSINHPYENLAATENYLPNVELCREKLLPLGVDFHKVDGNGHLPFADQSFELVINRHGNYNPEEIWRVLKPNGVFVTEQVGAENDRELAALLLKDLPALPFPKQYLRLAQQAFTEAGFSIVKSEEVFRPIRFWSVGALVWFAHIIEWEFPNFQVEDCLENLYKAQELLEQEGVIEGRSHRFLLVAEKSGGIKHEFT